jgi:RimJ/RimL family protein N-acetyltransferase
MSAINSDEVVMEFFPGRPTQTDTVAFMSRMQQQYLDRGFCYFAVDRLDNSEFAGFIGLSGQVFQAEFTPCMDIGWRLSQNAWNQGFAAEGAKKCLDFAFNQLVLKGIYSMAPKTSLKSIRVMEKIGMQKLMTFNHPKLINGKHLEECLLYLISTRDR